MRSATLYNFLIEANIMAGIAIMLMIPLRRFLRRGLGNGAICFGWLLIAVRLLCPLSLVNPLIHTIRSPYASDAAIRPIAGQVKVRLGDAVSRMSDIFWRADNMPGYEAASRLGEGLQDASAAITLAKVWLAGVMLTAAWFLFRNLRFRMRLRADRIEPISGELKERFEALCRERGVRPVPVYFTDPLPSACLVGVFRPYIALPLSASPQDAIHVLTHEICHLKIRDHIWGVLRLLCCAVHWFDPLVWLAAAMSRTDSELRCDDRVTGPMDPEARKSYAGVLVLSAARRNAPGLGVLATGMTMTGKRLKTRVETVMRGGKPMRWLAVTFAVLASMCLVGAFATSETKEQLEMGTYWPIDEHYLTEALHGNRRIQSESDAAAFAREVWDRVKGREAEGSFEVYREDGSWSVSLAEGDDAAFYLWFSSDGVIWDMSQDLKDYRWVTDGEYAESQVMDMEELNAVREWTLKELDALVPGLTGEIRTPELVYVRDVGDAKFVFLNASPKNSRYDAGASVFVLVRPEGEYVLVMLQLAGNG